MGLRFLLPKKPLENAFRDVEICAPQAVKRIAQIEQSIDSGCAQHAHRADEMQPPALCHTASIHIVDDQLIRGKLLGKQYGVAFTRIEVRLEQFGIRGLLRSYDFEPARRMGNPTTHNVRRARPS